MPTADVKRVLVLGASSEGGVGWATACRFAKQGAKLIVAARRAEALKALAAQIGGMAVSCDISDETQVAAIAQKLRDESIRIDAIVNAIGLVVPGTIESSESSHLQKAFATEYFGNFFLFKHLSPVVTDGGAIVLISSLASTHYVPGVLPYANAKAAANSLMKYAAVELAPRKIRVNSIVSGSIDTPMMDTIRENSAVMAAITKEIPLGRIATANEIAAAAEWLCSPECFMTGSLLQVDGGNHLRRAPFPEEMPPSTFDAHA